MYEIELSNGLKHYIKTENISNLFIDIFPVIKLDLIIIDYTIRPIKNLKIIIPNTQTIFKIEELNFYFSYQFIKHFKSKENFSLDLKNDMILFKNISPIFKNNKKKKN